MHTVYGGAHLFRSDSAQKLGAIALRMLDEYAPDAATLAAALGIAKPLAAAVRPRIAEKLRREPVEDYRIDFEDGYGDRTDEEEDAHARSAAEELAKGVAAAALPPFIGIRLKAMSRMRRARSLRTLELFLTTLHRSGARLPPDFAVTIPKVTSARQVSAIARACGAHERRMKLRPAGTLRLEVMVETPQALIGADGRFALKRLVDAGAGRVRGAHFGPYDYTAACGITAAWQDLRHPSCDFARHLMQAGLAQTSVQLSDGPTTLLPIPPHPHPSADDQHRANRDTVHRAWKRHFDDVTHSLVGGFYQSWDLHPAQLPTRYAAVYAFYLAARPAATVRLRNFIDRAARATRVGDAFDDAATGKGLLNFFTRGLNCGALTIDEVREAGLTATERPW